MKYFGKSDKIMVTPQNKRVGGQRNVIKMMWLSAIFSLCFAFFLSSYSFAQSSNSLHSSSAMLRETIERLVLLQSLKTTIRMDVYMDGEEYATQGKYVEEGFAASTNELPHSRFRLDLNFPLSSSGSFSEGLNKMTVLCDGNYVWHYTSIEETNQFHMIRIEQVLAAIKKSKKKPYYSSVGGIAGLGGLGGMLQSINENYVLTTEPEDFLLRGKASLKVWKLVGSMNSELRKELESQLGRKEEETSFSSHLPTDIELYLGQDDLFPYRIHYYNVPDPKRPQRRTLVTQLVFCDVIFNDGTIPDYLFTTFEKNGGSAPVDVTGNFIKSLGL